VFQNFPDSHTTGLTSGAALFSATSVAQVKKLTRLGSVYRHWMLLEIDF